MPSADALMHEADAALQARRAGDALQLYCTVLRQDPQRAAARYGAGLATLLAGDATLAGRMFRDAMLLDPAAPLSYGQTGSLLRRLDEPERADTAYRRALCLDPHLVLIRFNRGNLLAAQGRADEARAAFMRVLCEKPDLADAWHALGDTTASHDPGAALRGYRRALSLNPGYGPAWTNAIALLVRQGRLDEARALFRNALAITERWPTAAPEVLAAGYPLVDHNALDGLELHRSARLAWRTWRADPRHTPSLAVLAHYCYRRDRLPLASRLAQRTIAHTPREEVGRSFILRLWSMVHPEPAFLDSLPSEQETPAGVPPLPLDGLTPGDGQPILLSGDATYWLRYGADLVASIAETCTRPLVHAHLIDPTPDSRSLLERLRNAVPLTVTWEDTAWLAPRNVAERNTYYACARFLRLPALLGFYRRPIVAIDMDCVVARDLSALPLNAFDIGMLRDFNRPGPTREWNAAFFHVAFTPAGRVLAGRLAAYIARFIAYRPLYWMLDQAALGTIMSDAARTLPDLHAAWHDLHTFDHCRYIEK